jgi:hypothetical protein
MPCATIHLLVADRLLDGWVEHPREAPIDATEPELRAAFLHGSLAPDMGFIPGVDRLVSELSHYVRPIHLTRALLEGAETPLDHAFAWGWVAHVIGDVEIHPIVGRAVGERLYRDRGHRVDAAEDPETHVSVEVGLDVAFLLKHPDVSPPPRAPHFDRRRVGHFTGALARTYGVDWNAAHLVRGHGRAVRLTRRWPMALRALARARGAFSLGARVARARTATRGFFRPVPPPPWMVAEVGSAIETFPGRFRAMVREGLDSVPDRNLETGGPAGAGLGHPASDEAARKLGAIGGFPGATT